MTGTTIAKRGKQPMELDVRQLEYIANTSFIRADLRGKLPDIMACVLTGRELGMGDLEALRMLYIVDGKVTMPAELMVSRARARGHSITGKFNEDNTACTAIGKRADNGDEDQFTFTMEMAKRAGLDKKKNWTAYQESMLWARAVSQLCRMLFPDVLAGASYSKEELDEVGPSARDMNLAPAPVVETDEPISDGQRTRLWAIASSRNVPEPDLRRIVHRATGQDSTQGILRSQYEDVCALVEGYAPLQEGGDSGSAANLSSEVGGAGNDVLPASPPSESGDEPGSLFQPPDSVRNRETGQ